MSNILNDIANVKTRETREMKVDGIKYPRSGSCEMLDPSLIDERDARRRRFHSINVTRKGCARRSKTSGGKVVVKLN